MGETVVKLLIDIILGLLEPQKGKLEVDNKVINAKNLRRQMCVGYVPQNIYISDDTILANIALGVKDTAINDKSIIEAAKNAELHEFIINKLPDKYQTKLGERGIRLSGGERQRIGLARALYHKPKVLILDEATSALDNHTEKLIMNRINKLTDVTIIMIAHRLQALKNCNSIFKVSKGQLINHGSYKK